MGPEERRNEIIAATLPLLREHGANVTTSQIAQAAGIAEGTIFRVFQDKRELVLAALQSAMSADAEVARIGQISSDLPLTERLVAALATISDYQDRLWSLMRVMRESSWEHPRDELAHEDHNPRRQVERIGRAIAALFEPKAGSLRLEASIAAQMLVGQAFTNRMGELSTGPEQLVDLFLHGALKTHD